MRDLIGMLSPEEIVNHPTFNIQWYHSIELSPGIVTGGCDFDNLVVGRHLLNGVDVRGQRCLDVGAMDGLATFLMERRGASRVVAYDRNFRPYRPITNGDRFRFAHRALGSAAEYIWDVPMGKIQQKSQEIGIRTYDVIFFSGVLYHMFDPVAGLARMRNLVRDGGIVVVETGATLDASLSMHANAHGRFYPADDYWLPSVSVLEYWLRFLHLDPIDVSFLHHRIVDGLPVIRAAIVCRAIPTFRATHEDTWMKQQSQGTFFADFNDEIDWKALGSTLPDVPYRHSGSHLVNHPGNDVLDVFSSMTSNSAMQASLRPELLRLMLADK